MMIWLLYLGNILQKKQTKKTNSVCSLGTVNEDVSGIPYQLFIKPFLIPDSELPVIFFE